MAECQPNESLSFKRIEDLAPATDNSTPITLSTAFTHFLGIEKQDGEICFFFVHLF